MSNPCEDLVAREEALHAVETDRERELYFELEKTMSLLASLREAYREAASVRDEDERHMHLIMSEHRILHVRKVLYGDDPPSSTYVQL